MAFIVYHYILGQMLIKPEDNLCSDILLNVQRVLTYFFYFFIFFNVRYRSCGGKSQSQNELTVEELRTFVRQLDALPCNIRQAPLLRVSVVYL